MKKSLEYHRLDLTYCDYQAMSRNISKSRLGKYIVDYELKLGEGQFGKVYKGIDDDSKTEVAVKVIDLKAIREEKKEARRKILERLSDNEDKMMVRCNSPYLAKCFDVFRNNDLKIIVMEFCNRGTLTKYIEEKNTLPEDQAICILKQILKGVVELHSNRIIHRDLKTDNILMHDSKVKIVDFGFSKALENANDEVIGKHTSLGTVNTMAPEVLQGEKYGLKADIWSVGVIFYQMLFGDLPYISSDRAGLILLIKEKQKELFNQKVLTYGDVTISYEAQDFLKNVLKVNHRYRLGWKQVLKHPLFLRARDSSVNSILMDNPSIPSIPPKEDIEPEQFCEESQLPRTSSIRLIKMMSRQIEQKRRQLKVPNSTKWFNYMIDKLHDCSKIECVFNEIIEPIERRKLFDLDSREVIEMMYLMSARCFLDLSPICREIKEISSKDPRIERFCRHVKSLYQKIAHQWLEYSRLMTQKQNQLTSIIRDVFKPVSRLKQEDRFNNGIENKDFTREEHVEYIKSTYIIPLVRGAEHLQKKVKNLMLAYQDIVMADPQKLKNRGFSAYIDDIVNY